MDRLNYFVKSVIAYISMIMLWKLYNIMMNDVFNYTDLELIAVAVGIIAQGLLGSRYAYHMCALNEYDYDLKEIESQYKGQQ